MKIFRLAIIIFLCLGISACETTSSDFSQLFKGQSEEKIFQDGKAQMAKRHYAEAIQHFETLNSRYPFGKYAEQSLLDLIYAYYKRNELPSALATADRYIHLYPRSNRVDYAYYMKGLIQLEENRGFFERYFPTDFSKRDLSSLHKAYADFNRLTHYFPKSQYAPDAKQHMIYIRNMLAKNELQIAQFYYDHESYVAAANRANNVVQHYQGTPSVPEALKLMVKSYKKLNLNKEADDASKVLELNFGKK